MARTLTKTRKDSHGYSLRPGECQRSEGRYEFKYKGMDGKMHSIYAKKLTDLQRKKTASVMRSIRVWMHPRDSC